MKVKGVIPAGWKRVTHGKVKKLDRILWLPRLEWEKANEGIGDAVGEYEAIIRRVKRRGKAGGRRGNGGLVEGGT